MTITESKPSDLVRIRLDFLKPFQATNTAEFTFEPAGGQTAVAWTMTGRHNFMGKAMGLNADFTSDLLKLIHQESIQIQTKVMNKVEERV